MTADLRARCVYRSPLVRIMDYRCRALSPERSREETTPADSVVLPRGGVFVKHVRGEAVVADANQAVFFPRGEPYRVSHPVGCGDRCTSLAPSAAALAELLERHDPAGLDRSDGPFRVTHGPADPGADARHRILFRALDGAPGPDLGVDEAAAALLDAVFASAYRLRPWARGRDETRRAHRDLAEAAKLALAGRIRERVSLDLIARAVHSSPFHLARVFRRQTGMTMHRYLVRLRVRAALERLAEPGPRGIGADLSALAAELGFYDQSHLTNAFRAEAGTTPDRWRREAGVAGLRRLVRRLGGAPAPGA